MFDNARNRKDQKMLDAAGDFDDEPEVLESVEVCLIVLLLYETSKLTIHGLITNMSCVQRILISNDTRTEWRSVIEGVSAKPC